MNYTDARMIAQFNLIQEDLAASGFTVLIDSCDFVVRAENGERYVWSGTEFKELMAVTTAIRCLDGQKLLKTNK